MAAGGVESGGGRDAPKQDRGKFREVYLHLLGLLAERPQAGEASVHVLLYFIDFDYYELRGEQLMGLEYVRGGDGPEMPLLGEWTAEMEREGLVVRARGVGGGGLPRVAEGVSANLAAFEREHVDGVVGRLARATDLGGVQLCGLARCDIPWIGAPAGGVLAYAGALFRTAETSVRAAGGHS